MRQRAALEAQARDSFENLLPNLPISGYISLYLEAQARDSFENLLFSVCRFRELSGDYPG